MVPDNWMVSTGHPHLLDGAERKAEIVDLKYWGTIIGYDGKKSAMYLWPVRGGE